MTEPNGTPGDVSAPAETPLVSEANGGGKLDPIVVEIIEGTLASVEAEVEDAIGRTARSPMIRDQHDFRAGIHDAKLRKLTGRSYSALVQPVVRDFPIDEMKPGDIYFHNDVYLSEGVYYFSRIALGNYVNLHIDTGGGDVLIFVQGAVATGARFNATVTGGSKNPTSVRHSSNCGTVKPRVNERTLPAAESPPDCPARSFTILLVYSGRSRTLAPNGASNNECSRIDSRHGE